MNDDAVFTGGCLCGAVRFEVTPPTKWCAHCHCSLCRRAHGAAFVTWIGVEKTCFMVVSGTEHIGWHQSTSEARRGLCKLCGSTMLFEGERWPDEVHIALANMEGPIDRSPQAHVFFDRHVDWVEICDDLPHFGGASGTELLED